MEVFKSLKEGHHEQAVFCSDRDAGLRAIIVIHDTTLGPALGGVRMRDYGRTDDAFADCLTLARAMTYKAAVAGLNLGGGQAVIVGDPRQDKSEALLLSLGRFVEGLGGRFVTAVDLGTTVEDLRVVRASTKHVAGLSQRWIKEGKGPPYFAAYGVCASIKRICAELLGKPSLRDVRVIVQGVGQVGTHVATMLAEEGATIYLSDILPRRARELARKLGATFVPSEKMWEVKADVLSPCAVGGILDTDAVSRLKVKLVAGSANNQLDQEASGVLLFRRKILYAPDFLVNAGGYISVAGEMAEWDQQEILGRVAHLSDVLLEVFRVSQEKQIPTQRVAEDLAEQRILKIGRLRSKFL
jgi:leucine dehydrogenase